MRKKLFIVTGELSGDRLAAWYLKRLLSQNQDLHVQAIGGDFVRDAGAQLYDRFEKLNVTGIVEILRHIPNIVRFLKNISNYICEQAFDEVVLVDFPGFNLRLAKQLKKKKPNLKITYLSPPQLWCWGAWRIKPLKQYCDRIIVLYPFEVAWYAKRGVRVEWLGSPVSESSISYHQTIKQPVIALIPGSRISEIKSLFPLFMRAASLFKKMHPEVSFILPLARSIPIGLLEFLVKKHNAQDIWQSVKLLHDEHEKFLALSTCCLALSKPGTVTLELALLEVPTLVAYKTSWITYFLARLVVYVSQMALPNLLLNKEVFKEIIQYDCSPHVLAKELDRLYIHWHRNTVEYQQIKNDMKEIKHILDSKMDYANLLKLYE